MHMATYTNNYGLHQWAPTDPFQRLDFNQDFSKIDAALGTLAGLEGADRANLEHLSYHIYNLLLQNDYEGKSTGYKQALLFDGFQDESNIASKSSEIIFSGNAAGLYGIGQNTLNLGAYSSYSSGSPESAVVSATGAGRVTGFTCKILNLYAVVHAPDIHATLVQNGRTVLEQSFNTGDMPASASQVKSFSFEESFPFGPGDQFQLSLQCYQSEAYLTEHGGSLAGALNAQAVTGTSGTITASAAALPAFSRALGWVRHSGGAVELSLTGSSTLAFLLEGQRQTVEPFQGAACTESAFVLEQAGAAETRAVQLSLTRGAEDRALIYDYGVVLL